MSLRAAVDFFKTGEDALAGFKLDKDDLFIMWGKAREAAETAPSRVCPEDAAAGLSSVRGVCCVRCGG